MATSVRSALMRETEKLIARHNRMCQTAAMERKRYRRRSGCAATHPPAKTPTHWSAHPHFDPYYVRSRQDSILHAISKKLSNGTYQPSPILIRQIPKPGGGTRGISILTLPDAAISYYLGSRLIERNAHFFTSYTYAYRRDRNAHHAIQHLMSELRGASRMFILEFDFSKYFDTIDHQYVLDVLSRDFLTSKRERDLVLRFLKCQRADDITAYCSGTFTTPSNGIPQGCTLSLFLANVACHKLDREIEREGAVFARYADDTAILCDSYDKADRCARRLMDHGKRAGTKVNFSKSEGISILSPQGKAEMKATSAVDFLAHSLSSDGVGISARSRSRIKKNGCADHTQTPPAPAISRPHGSKSSGIWLPRLGPRDVRE